MDNGAGVATILELARILIQSGERFEKTIRFIFFGVEELACVGSSFYVLEHKEELDQIHLMINIDGQGEPGGKTFDVAGFDDTAEYILNFAKEINYPMKLKNPSFGGDSVSFTMGGVPTACLRKSGTPGMFNYKGPVNMEDREWGHTSGDTPDKLTPFALIEGGIISGRLLVRAADHKGKIAEYRNKQAVDKILQDYRMDEVFHYMKWPTLPITSKY